MNPSAAVPVIVTKLIAAVFFINYPPVDPAEGGSFDSWIPQYLLIYTFTAAESASAPAGR
jgi:hypothetical protein